MKKHIGSSFESFLEEKGIKDDAELLAQKEILADQIREAMDRKGVTFSALASSMGTSRTVVYRLLDPKDTGVSDSRRLHHVRSSPWWGSGSLLHGADRRRQLVDEIVIRRSCAEPLVRPSAPPAHATGRPPSGR